MSTTLIAIRGPRSIREQSSVTMTARFRDRDAVADVIPTNARYRVDDEYGCELVGWTSLTPAASIDIAIPASASRVYSCKEVEGRLLTVEADAGIDTQFSTLYQYEVQALPWRAAA